MFPKSKINTSFLPSCILDNSMINERWHWNHKSMPSALKLYTVLEKGEFSRCKTFKGQKGHQQELFTRFLRSSTRSHVPEVNNHAGVPSQGEPWLLPPRLACALGLRCLGQLRRWNGVDCIESVSSAGESSRHSTQISQQMCWSSSRKQFFLHWVRFSLSSSLSSS